MKCFKALCGQISLVWVLEIISNLSRDDAEFVDNHCDWTIAEHWASWWMRPTHLKMLHKDFSAMTADVWKKCPMPLKDETRTACKQQSPLPVRQCIVNIYKLDKAFFTKFLAAMHGSYLSYNSRSVQSRKEAAETRQSQRKRAANIEKDHDSQFGPPDKKKHFMDTGKRYNNIV